MPKYFRRKQNKIVDSGSNISNRVCLAIPMTGLLRSEWVLHRYGQIIPVNWSNGEIIQWFDTFSPLHYAVDHARNVSVRHAVENKFEWLLFIDHDVILPPDCFVKMNNYISEGKYPVVAGLYAAKGNPPEPLVFRGYGNSWYRGWKKGDKVWADGVPMGCTLISMKLLAPMYHASEEYEVHGQRARKVFHTPRDLVKVPNSPLPQPSAGTEDLWWCDRVMREGWLKKTGFTNVANKKYPFLCDTGIWCGHINEAGQIYWPGDPGETV